jgi:DNA-binding NtrC family response regulator
MAEDAATLEIPQEKPAGMFWLEVGEVGNAQRVAVPEGATIELGTRGSCAVRLRDRTVSAKHCRVACVDGQLLVEDLGSRNGLYVGGAVVRRAQLVSGTCFVVGRVTVGVQRGEGTPGNDGADDVLPGVIGGSLAMRKLARRVRLLARVSVPVLVRGETGTGKELVARALHDLGPRAAGPFIALNAGTLTRDLAASELFGHDRGAFTGAFSRRDGHFASAHGGTLFLDEVRELPLDVQVHLLRVLEIGEVRAVGSSMSRQVDVRLVAATWAPLRELVAEGRFREDLYHRLAVGTVRVPSLEERRSDIAALAQYFLQQALDEVGPKRLTPAALGYLAAQRWPGNVRQLRNTIRSAAALTLDEVVDAEGIEMALRDQPMMAPRMSRTAAHALVAACGGNVAVAAKRCGVPRSTFRGWLNRRLE